MFYEAEWFGKRFFSWAVESVSLCKLPVSEQFFIHPVNCHILIFAIYPVSSFQLSRTCIYGYS